MSSLQRVRKTEVPVTPSPESNPCFDGVGTVKHAPPSRPQAGEDSPVSSSSTIIMDQLSEPLLFSPLPTLLSLMVLEQNNQPILRIPINKSRRIISKYINYSSLGCNQKPEASPSARWCNQQPTQGPWVILISLDFSQKERQRPSTVRTSEFTSLQAMGMLPQATHSFHRWALASDTIFPHTAHNFISLPATCWGADSGIWFLPPWRGPFCHRAWLLWKQSCGLSLLSGRWFWLFPPASPQSW